MKQNLSKVALEDVQPAPILPKIIKLHCLTEEVNSCHSEPGRCAMWTVLPSQRVKSKQTSKRQHKLGKLKHNKQMSFVLPYLQSIIEQKKKSLSSITGEAVTFIKLIRTYCGLAQLFKGCWEVFFFFFRCPVCQ